VLVAYVERLLRGWTGSDDALARFAADRLGLGQRRCGPALELLTARMPGEHHLLFTEVDGNFPNHHPDPTEEKNLADLKALVAAKNLDFG
jgi:phosphomannomutase